MKKLIACGIFLILIGCGVHVSIDSKPEPAPKYAFRELQPTEDVCYDGYWLVHIGMYGWIYRLNSLGGPVPCPLYGTTH